MRQRHDRHVVALLPLGGTVPVAGGRMGDDDNVHWCIQQGYCRARASGGGGRPPRLASSDTAQRRLRTASRHPAADEATRQRMTRGPGCQPTCTQSSILGTCEALPNPPCPSCIDHALQESFVLDAPRLLVFVRLEQDPRFLAGATAGQIVGRRARGMTGPGPTGSGPFGAGARRTRGR